MKLSRIIPKNSFVGKYMEYASNSETARDYDFWCAMWCIGSAIGRNIVVDRGTIGYTHMNWYLVLCAESATTRKSSAVRLAHKVLTEVVPPYLVHTGRTTAPVWSRDKRRRFYRYSRTIHHSPHSIYTNMVS